MGIVPADSAFVAPTCKYNDFFFSKDLTIHVISPFFLGFLTVPLQSPRIGNTYTRLR